MRSAILYGVMLGVLCAMLFVVDDSTADERKKYGKEAVVYFADTADDACRSHRDEFSLERLRDLHVCVIWYRLDGTYVQRVAFYLPSGHLYQVLTTPFVTPEASGPAEVDVDGRLVAVQAGRWKGKWQTGVVTVLPVAGTFITQRDLVGTWRVDVTLNGRLAEQVELTLKRHGQE